MKLSLSLIILTLSIITLNVSNAINYNPIRFSSGSGSGTGTGASSYSSESSEQSSSSSLNPFYFFVNFQLYGENCGEPIPGVWFGIMQDDNNVVCLQNTTSGSIGIVAEPLAVNLTSSTGSKCSNSNNGWAVLNRDECSTIPDGSNYYVEYSKEAQYPSTSISGGPRYAIQNYDEDCETVLSYWIADSGTTVEDYTNTFNTQYLCDEKGTPSITVCTSQGSCKNTLTSKKCSSSSKSLSSITCI